MLAAGCQILGRYPKNAETTYFELEQYCPNINSYEEFERILLSYLSDHNVPYESNTKILNKHYTSKRVELLTSILKNH